MQKQHSLLFIYRYHLLYSLLYSEYGMDSILYPNNFADSPIFKDDWFGQANPLNDEHRVEGGRWSQIKMPSGEKYASWSISETGKLNPFVNPYGIMRSPWNKNPSQYITRHNSTYGMTQYSSMPTCSTLRGCFFSKSVVKVRMLSWCIVVRLRMNLGL